MKSGFQYLLWIFLGTVFASAQTPQYGIPAEEFPALLDKFEKYAQKSFEEWKVPGMAIGIVKDGKLAYAKGFGVQVLNGKDKIDEHTVFQIGSLTKAFTATLTAIAIDKKKLNWTDKVVDALPEFMMFDPWVTRQFEVEDLLAQRSGLQPYAGDQQSNLGFNVKELIHNLRFSEPITSFRSAFAYQNIFFIVAAELLKAKTGQAWDELLYQEILNPLEMRETTVGLNPFFNAKNHASLHIRNLDGKIEVLGSGFPYNAGVYLYAPAGGINSNVVDMSKWIMLQLDQGKQGAQQIVSKDNLERLFRPHVVGSLYEEAINYYCLGWAFRENSPYPIIWHNGGTAGVNNMLAIVPEEKVGIVVLCNTRGTLLAEALALQFFDMYFNKPDKQWSQKLLAKLNDDNHKALDKYTAEINTKSTWPPLPLQDYAGTYRNAMYGNAVVALENNGLTLQMGPNRVQAQLKHLNRDIFTLVWPYVTDNEISLVSFELDENGKPVSMTVDALQKAKFTTEAAN